MTVLIQNDAGSKITIDGRDVKKALGKVRTNFVRLAKSVGSLLYTISGNKYGGRNVGEKEIFLFSAHGQLGFMMFNDDATVIWHPDIDDTTVDTKLHEMIDACGTVSVEDFYKITKSTNAVNIGVEFGDKIVFTKGRKSYSIAATSNSEMLLSAFNSKVDSYNDDEGPLAPFTVKSGLSYALRNAHKFTGDARTHLINVNLVLDGHSATVASTNGHYLYLFKSDGIEADNPRVEMFVSKTVLECVSKIGDDLKVQVANKPQIFSALNDDGHLAGDYIKEIRVNVGNFLFFSHYNATYTPNFPDYTYVIPDYHSAGGESMATIIDRDMILKAFKEAKNFVSKANSVKLRFDRVDSLVNIESGNEGLSFDMDCPVEFISDWADRALLSVNVDYAAQCFDVMDSEEILFEFIDTLKPTVLSRVHDSCEDRTSEQIILMPMRK